MRRNKDHRKSHSLIPNRGGLRRGRHVLTHFSLERGNGRPAYHHTELVVIVECLQLRRRAGVGANHSFSTFATRARSTLFLTGLRMKSVAPTSKALTSTSSPGSPEMKIAGISMPFSRTACSRL